MTTDLPGLLAVAPSTDLDRGRLLLRFLRATGREVLYADATEDYYLWEGSGAWRRTSPTALRRVAHLLHDEGRSLANAALAEYRADPRNTDLTVVRARADRYLATSAAFGNGRTIDGALREMRADPTVSATPGDFDTDPDVLGVRNGVVDLRTGALRPYTAADRVSRVVDVDYDPDAEAPRWLEFLDEILVDADGRTDRALVDFMRRLIGYGITGHTREQRLPIFHGKGGTGKGTFLQTLSALFAEHAEDAAFETFEERSPGRHTEDLARLAGARLVFASEGRDGAPMAEAVLKRVTGSDPITARLMHRNSFTYTPSFLLILATNHRPAWAGDDDAIWRRVLLVPFLASIPEARKVPGLADLLREEWPGILAWVVRGAGEWHREGLGVPDAVTTATDTYREDSHPLAEWLADAAEVSGDRNHETKRTDLRQDYLSWIAANGGTDLGERTVGRLLDDVPGVVPFKRNNAWWLRGIRLLTPAERRARTR